jgi:hypothetical protein
LTAAGLRVGPRAPAGMPSRAGGRNGEWLSYPHIISAKLRKSRLADNSISRTILTIIFE